MPAWEKGKEKTGGRQKGTLNKSKTLVREAVEKALGKTIPERLLELAQVMAPEDEADILIDLMPYCYPKFQTIECSLEAELGEEDRTQQQELIQWIKDLKEVK